jgi:hypothetical protein
MPAQQAASAGGMHHVTHATRRLPAPPSDHHDRTTMPGLDGPHVLGSDLRIDEIGAPSAAGPGPR